MVLCFDFCGKLCPAGCIIHSYALSGVFCHSLETEERARKRILKGQDIKLMIVMFLRHRERVLDLIIVGEQGSE